MKRIQLTKNFYLDEYIPEAIYRAYQSRPHLLIGMLDKQQVESDQMLRDHLGPVTINNWWTGDNRDQSGIRVPGQSYYSITSGHSFGHASDKIFKDVSAEYAREFIKKNWQSLGITEIELGTSWVHSGNRWYPNQKELIMYEP